MNFENGELQYFLDDICREINKQKNPKSLNVAEGIVFRFANEARKQPWLSEKILEELILRLCKVIDISVENHQRLVEFGPQPIVIKGLDDNHTLIKESKRQKREG